MHSQGGGSYGGRGGQIMQRWGDNRGGYRGGGNLLSQSLDDSGTTLGECLGRTRWSSSLDSTTYLYYFTSGCTSISTRSHVLPEHSMII